MRWAKHQISFRQHYQHYLLLTALWPTFHIFDFSSEANCLIVTMPWEDLTQWGAIRIYSDMLKLLKMAACHDFELHLNVWYMPIKYKHVESFSCEIHEYNYVPKLLLSFNKQLDWSALLAPWARFNSFYISPK